MAHKERYTVETLASGQPRPYADTIRHVRVSFESTPWNGGDELQPAFMSEEAARRRLQHTACGFTPKTASEVQWFDTRLDWLKPIDGKAASEVISGGNPKQIVASVWEFHTTSPYTD